MLSNEELYNIKGGSVSLTGSLLTGILGIVNKIFELGRAVGSGVRRVHDKNICSYN